MLVLMGLGMNMGLALVLTGAGMAWVLNFWDTQLLAQNLVAGVDSFAPVASAGASSTWRRPGLDTCVAAWAMWPSARPC
jgi:hypothetical protein